MKARVGQQVKRLREQRNLSQVDLAKRAGVTQPCISMLEHGVSAHPTVPLLERLATALGVNAGDLLK